MSEAARMEWVIKARKAIRAFLEKHVGDADAKYVMGCGGALFIRGMREKVPTDIDLWVPELGDRHVDDVIDGMQIDAAGTYEVVPPRENQERWFAQRERWRGLMIEPLELTRLVKETMNRPKDKQDLELISIATGGKG